MSERIRTVIDAKEYTKLEAELARVKDAHDELLVNAMCDESREKVRELLAEHGVLDQDCWAHLKDRLDKLEAELAAEREKVERLEPMAEFGQRLLDMTESLTDPVVTQADDKVDAYIEVFIRQKREIERLRELLREVEWDGEVTDREREWLCSACLFCDGIPTHVEKTTNMSHLHSGHKPDCPLAAALNPDAAPPSTK